MFYHAPEPGTLVSGAHITTPDGDWTEADRDTPPPGWLWFDTLMEAREHFGVTSWLDPTTVVDDAPAIAATMSLMTFASVLDTAWAEHVETAELAPFDPVPQFGWGPGERVLWEGETWRNVSGAWLHSSPADYPLGWAQETGLPADVPEWQPGEAVTVGELRTYQGVTYRVVQAHTTQAGWEPPNLPALWASQE